LEYLAKQKTAADLNWEIIVVDNKSTDGTAASAWDMWKSSGCVIPLKIVTENKPGLNYARQAGVKAADYDIIIFCDDDNLLTADFVQSGYHLVQKTKNEGYGIWGGTPIACFDENVTIPDWFEKEQSNYVVGKQGDKTGDISYRGYLWGAGMIILKNIFLSVINEEVPLLLTDRVGSNLSSGGDSEISLRALIAGYKLYYKEDLLFKHYIPTSRLTVDYNNKLKKGFQLSDRILTKYWAFLYYVSGKNFLHRFFYSCVYLSKYYMNKINARKLTDHDKTVLSALFKKKFPDADFDLMRQLLKIKT